MNIQSSSTYIFGFIFLFKLLGIVKFSLSFLPLPNTFSHLVYVAFDFISPWIRLQEVPRFYFINPVSWNGKHFIYIINPLAEANASFFSVEKKKRWWGGVLEEQSAFQTWKLFLFVWCLSSLLHFLRWNTKGSHYHVEMSALRKRLLGFMKKFWVSKQRDWPMKLPQGLICGDVHRCMGGVRNGRGPRVNFPRASSLNTELRPLFKACVTPSICD